MTRRYHGLLIAALPAPLGRMIMLSHLHERLDLADAGVAAPATGGRSTASGEAGASSWTSRSSAWRAGCRSGGTSSAAVALEKRLLLPYRQNTVHVSYRLHRRRRPRSISTCGRRSTSARTSGP